MHCVLGFKAPGPKTKTLVEPQNPKRDSETVDVPARISLSLVGCLTERDDLSSASRSNDLASVQGCVCIERKMVNAVRKLHTFGFLKNVSRPDAYDRLSRCFWRSETATLVSARFFGSWSDGGGGTAAAATSSSWSSLGFGRGFSSSQSGILIKALRERTGAPIKDVKAVLEQCGWDSGIGFSQLL